LIWEKRETMRNELKDNIFLPVSINITGRKILVVGGGKVAAHKVKLLSRFTKDLTVLAPVVCDSIKSEGYHVIEKNYEASYLQDYFLVYACTDNQELNAQIKQDANHRSILVNVADNPALCDFVSPAIYKQDELTVAVGSNAQNVKKSIAVRDRISTYLEENPLPGPVPSEKPIDSDRGKVTLVGFGPGNPELLTVKAVKYLKAADIIFYDALLESSYLHQFNAEKIPVGKRYGMHSKQQDEINELLLQAAQSGKKVVRLKGGDPMIFGRGGEEINYLTEYGIQVEIIPGITTALAAAAQFSIPLTHRYISSSVAFCNGHNLTSDNFPKADTIVLYMGANCQSEIAEKLIQAGWDKKTPVALMSRVSHADSKKVLVTLGELALKEAHTDTPLLIIVGETAAGMVNEGPST
jgi:uroporphyrin-III C-methyltransferase / precorrin-2 dehydrogenase / sirohydrochlorin ferrochelatase